MNWEGNGNQLKDQKSTIEYQKYDPCFRILYFFKVFQNQPKNQIDFVSEKFNKGNN